MLRFPSKSIHPLRLLLYPVGWILVWDKGVSNNFFYVEGTPPDGTNDPCNGYVPNLQDTDTLTFYYDRQSATDYATSHALFNDMHLPECFRVTHRIGVDTPFANFYYSVVGHGYDAEDLNGDGIPEGNEENDCNPSAVGTGSAVFISESMWVGSLPMVIGDPQSCTSASVAEAGWRYCAVNNGGSQPWSYHSDLIDYYTDSLVANDPESNMVLTDISPTNILGTFVGFIYAQTSADGSQLGLNPDYLTLRTSVILNQLKLSEFIQNQLGGNSQLIQKGDYVWIDPLLPHGFLVAGWGESLPCADALESTRNSTYRLWNSLNEAENDASAPRLPDDISTSSIDESSIALVIPYVVDFPVRIQSSIPRPFYCSWNTEGRSNGGFDNHNWRFYTMPNKVTITEVALFDISHWAWSKDDGQNDNN